MLRFIKLDRKLYNHPVHLSTSTFQVIFFSDEEEDSNSTSLRHKLHHFDRIHHKFKGSGQKVEYQANWNSTGGGKQKLVGLAFAGCNNVTN